MRSARPVIGEYTLREWTIHERLLDERRHTRALAHWSFLGWASAIALALTLLFTRSAS